MAASIESFAAGFSSGLGLLRRRRPFAWLCVAILTLGFSLSATLFGAVSSLLLRPLPFEGAERWMRVELREVETGQGRLPSGAEFLAWRKEITKRLERAARPGTEAPAIERLAAFSMYMATVEGPAGGGAAYPAAEVSSEVLEMAEARPILGRLIQPADERPGAPRVAVIDQTLWRRHFDADSDAIGRSLTVDGEPAILIGVLQSGVSFPHSQELWLNLRLDRASEAPLEVVAQLSGSRFFGAPPRSAERSLGARRGNPRPRTNLEPYARSQVDRRLRRAAAPLLGAVAALLLITCSNAGLLLLGRSIERR
ncbi:MAG: ABC transporter permease, partial [Acidobacteriota bacterium]